MKRLAMLVFMGIMLLVVAITPIMKPLWDLAGRLTDWMTK